MYDAMLKGFCSAFLINDCLRCYPLHSCAPDVLNLDEVVTEYVAQLFRFVFKNGYPIFIFIVRLYFNFSHRDPARPPLF